MKDIENDEFVKEIFELSQTDEIAKMAEERFEKFKREYDGVELKEAEIFNVLNASYIAQRFFGKSRYWISQKLNHNIKNGKESAFTDAEYKQLKNAIETIALELQALSDSM